MKLIKLTQGKYAKTDDEDFEELNKYKWHTHKEKYTFYARRSLSKKVSIGGRRRSVLMHRVIMHVPPGMECDHIRRP